MKATDGASRDDAMRRATVDFPDPEPPAMPTINGGMEDSMEPCLSTKSGGGASGLAAADVSQLSIVVSGGASDGKVARC